MICPKCGGEVQDGVKFCKHCGAELSAATGAAGNQQEPAQKETVKKEPVIKNPVKAKKKTASNEPLVYSQLSKNKEKTEEVVTKKPASVPIIPIAIGVVAALVVIIGAVIFVKNLPTKIDLNEYVSVKFDGYDTMGTARIEYDDELLEVVGKEIGLSKKEIGNLGSVEELLAGNDDEDPRDIRKLRSCIKAIEFSLDKTSDLSNGDSIKLSVDFNNEKVKEYKIKYVGQEATFTVKDLEKINFIDVFADYTLTFSGISPEGSANGEYHGQTTLEDGYTYINAYNFNLDKYYSLRNGDTVTVTVDVYEDELIRRGYKLKELSKTFTVEGLDEYVMAYENISSDYLNYAKSETQDMITADMAKKSDCNLEGLEYAGYVFEGLKKDASSGTYNELYVIYRGDVTYTSQDIAQSVKVYFPVRFYNILSTSEGLNGNKDDGITGSTNLPGTWTSVRGYSNPIVAYDSMAKSKVDKYEIEAGDGFEAFADYTPVTALADISEENLQVLNDKAMDILNQYIIKSYDPSSGASDTVVFGYYLLVAKNQSNNFSQNNRIYVVYQSTISNSQNKFEESIVYFPIEFNGIVNLPNGEFMYAEDGGIKGNSKFEGRGYWTTKGYRDGEAMFNDLVTANRVNYTYELSENLKVFGE